MPDYAKAMHAGAVKLKSGECMDWHSTNNREELIIMLSGSARVELLSAGRKRKYLKLNKGQCVFLPHGTLHRVVNHQEDGAHYLYVNAPIR